MNAENTNADVEVGDSPSTNTRTKVGPSTGSCSRRLVLIIVFAALAVVVVAAAVSTLVVVLAVNTSDTNDSQLVTDEIKASETSAASLAPTNALATTVAPTSRVPTSAPASSVITGAPTPLGDFFDEDPFDGVPKAEASLWRTRPSGLGLSLTVVNALEERSIWQDVFGAAVDNWDSGNPDSLTLFVDTSTQDAVCRAVTGQIKVCNGNYGATKWRGISKILLVDNWIFSASSRLNDFYFTNTTDVALRRYTMCHELGHAFGLPHFDEDPDNADTGNCMDLTRRPEANVQPGEASFQTLAVLYGIVNSNSTTEGQGNRALGKVPVHIQQAFDQIDRFYEAGMLEAGGRSLRESGLAAVHDFDLGDGFGAIVHQLLA